MSYLQKFKFGEILTGTLTNAYAGGLSVDINLGEIDQIALYVDYDMGATETSNTLEIKVTLADGTGEFYRRKREAVSSGTVTLSPEEYVLQPGTSVIILKDLIATKIRVYFKETGVVTNFGSLRVEAQGMTTR